MDAKLRTEQTILKIFLTVISGNQPKWVQRFIAVVFWHVAAAA
jgi:hypothetical protein